ncbi:MAG TPA: alpha/beta fold hydrolase [Myxococcales bacterium]|nr:alpha/beta fold hydrolase [Myxococcales bacterium]
MLAWLLLAAAALALLLLVQGLRRVRRRPARKSATTRYPVVLAHGFLGFDEIGVGERKHLYFRGVGPHLEAMGARVYSPRVPPASTVAVRAQRLADLIRELPDERVNIVAHSMGGLDARYAISRLGLGAKVASLTTIGTPHLGTPLANPGNALFGTVSRVLRHLFDLVAFGDFTREGMKRFNADVTDDPQVAYQSVVGRSRRWRTHPLLWPTHLYLAQHSGANDGVVPADSQRWGVVMREVDADHWAQIGWSSGFDAKSLYEDLLRELRGRGF